MNAVFRLGEYLNRLINSEESKKTMSEEKFNKMDQEEKIKV